MSKSKNLKFQIELKEISGISPGPSQCKIEVGGHTGTIDSKNSMICTLEEVAVTTVITITLTRASETIGVCRVSFNAMFGESLQGKAEKWVRLKEVNPSGRDLKVKVAASLGNVPPPKEKPSQAAKPLPEPAAKSAESKISEVSLNKPKSREAPRCPYVTKLTDYPADTAKLQEIWKNREFLGDMSQEKSIRVTLEPETISKPGTEVVKYDTSTLDVLDIEKLRELSGFHLKKLLKSLTEEVKTAYYSALNLPSARSQLSLKFSERLEKHSEAESLSKSILSTSLEKSDLLADLLAQRKTLTEQLLIEEDTYKELEADVDSSKAEVGNFTRENIRLRAECIRYGDADKVHRELQAQVKDGLTRKQNLEKAFQASEVQLKSLKDRSEGHRDKLKKERGDLESGLKELLRRKEEAMKENNYLKRHLSEVKQRTGAEQNIKQLLKDARGNNTLEGSKRDQTYYDLQDFINQMHSQIEDFKQKQKTLSSNRKFVCQSISSLEHDLENKENSIIDLKRKLCEGACNQITLEQMYCIKSDVSQMIDEVNKLQRVHNEGREIILKGLDHGVDYVMKESEQVIEDTRELDMMIDSLDNKDYELDNLKIMVGEGKLRTAPYVARVDDPIDVALSEYLNSLDDPIPIPFTRENEGVYLFGTKRIFLKLENCKVRIRVGGGYTNIEEFIEIYTTTELERQEEAIEEIEPQLGETLNRFSGKMGMSPQRAARIIHSTVEAVSHGSPLKASVREKNPKKK